MNKNKQILLVIVVILLMTLFSACDKDASLQTAQYKGSITVGYYPGSYLNEPVVNIIRTIASSMELEVYLKSQTKETWQADLHNGDIDIMIDEDNGVDMLSDPLFFTKVLFIENEDASLDKGGMVGVMDVGFIRDSAVAVTDFHNAQYSYYAIPRMLVQDFELGYLDGIIINEVDYIPYRTVENVQINEINKRAIYVVFEQGDITLLDEFNAQLQNLQNSGILQSLIYVE